MKNNTDTFVRKPVSRQEMYDYQQIMALMRIEILLNKVLKALDKDNSLATEEVISEDIGKLDYNSMTKKQLVEECKKQGIKITQSDNKQSLIEKLSN